jgi:hypothetical protein
VTDAVEKDTAPTDNRRSALTGCAAVSESASRHKPCRRYDDLLFSVVVLVDK